MGVHEDSNDHSRAFAARLNQNCFCITLSPEALHHALEKDGVLQGSMRNVCDDVPNLFARTPYFVSRRQFDRMAEVIRAVESVVALPAYRERALARAPDIARFDPGPKGVFFGYDFHLQGEDARLIEINTNAGGALINTTLARAQRPAVHNGVACRDPVAEVERGFVEMFRAEYRQRRGEAPLGSIAIVDVNPESQYLNLEFRLFQRLFQRSGIDAVVADPKEMTLRADGLWHRDLKIDLVYNRLTDFSLDDPENEVLREAYLSGRVVLTPHPRAHALYADKRNLAILTDEELLRAWGVPDSTRAALLSGVPHTVLVKSENCEMLWAERRRLFFKPSAGYGSKAAYRGDKLTKRVWQEILSGEYVAQELVAPDQRRMQTDGEPISLKVDVRAYVYDGSVQLLAARMYQGQTTNFRTVGGGFAGVIILDDARSCALKQAASNSQSPVFVNPFYCYICGHPFDRS